MSSQVTGPDVDRRDVDGDFVAHGELVELGGHRPVLFELVDARTPRVGPDGRGWPWRCTPCRPALDPAGFWDDPAGSLDPDLLQHPHELRAAPPKCRAQTPPNGLR
jgi:hypothetical protein